MVRDYNPNDKETIIKLGSKLHKQYKFNLDLFSKCKVLQIGDNIVGFVTYSVIYERAELIDIIIDEQFRKRGYGSKLLKSVIDDAILQNCDNITLEVREDNYSAINLYKRYNFEVVAVRKNYYKDKDAYLMKLSLEVTK